MSRAQMMDGFTVRPATVDDIPALEKLPFSSGLTSKHRGRIARQQRDEAILILATVDARVIGHLLLKWDCPSNPVLRTLAPLCSEVEDFVVEPELRGRGVGSALLSMADDLTRERGFRHIGLAVEMENPSARSIYEHCGYVVIPGSGHRVSWKAHNAKGEEVNQHEDCVYLVKELT